MTSKLLRPLRLPAQIITRKAPLPEPGRIALLYAQPLSRIVRLTVDDLIRDGDQVLLRLGEPPSPVPAPVAELLLAWIAQRDNMNTATNPNSRWLFPGRRAGQPMHPRTLGMLVTGLGVPTTTGRTAAIEHHVLTMSAPVIADALGYHRSPPRKSPREPGAPGAATPRATTHRYLADEPAIVDYAISPLSATPCCAHVPCWGAHVAIKKDSSMPGSTPWT
ncbi:hypothetical protein ACFWMR_06725 [Amycolatopsis thailandensis]|uniref:hypothetical protein n=1 Tax=Amycolatopsis thailandensis TaxID=589330 RepID=UPI0036661BE8